MYIPTLEYVTILRFFSVYYLIDPSLECVLISIEKILKNIKSAVGKGIT